MNSQQQYQPHEQNNAYYNVKSIDENTPEIKNTQFNKQVFKHNTTNGGLYSGPQNNNPWGSIHITPTATNYIQLFNNLNKDVIHHQPSIVRFSNNTLFK